jgi:hypothetical protein
VNDCERYIQTNGGCNGSGLFQGNTQAQLQRKEKIRRISVGLNGFLADIRMRYTLNFKECNLTNTKVCSVVPQFPYKTYKHGYFTAHPINRRLLKTDASSQSRFNL